MHVTTEMTVLRFEDMTPFAEARQLAILARDLAFVAPRDAQRAALAELAGVARVVLVVIAQALRAADPHDELRGLRDAQVMLTGLRAQAYDAYVAHSLDGRRHDQLVLEAARLSRELDHAVLSARRRARRRIDEA